MWASSHRPLLALAGLLLVVRLAAAVALRHTFFVSGFTTYDIAAENLLHGRGFTVGGAPFVAFPPLYALVLALAYAVFGYGWWSVAILQTAFDLASLVLLYALGRRFFGRNAALVACAVYAVYPLLASQSAQVLSTSLFVLFLLAFLYVLVRVAERPTVRGALIAGAVAGLGFEVRAEMLVVLVLTPALLAILRLPRAEIARASAYAAAAFVLAVTPMTVRNAIDFHRFAPQAAEGGITLWEGNSPHSAEFVAAGKSGDLLFALPDAPRPPASYDAYQVDDFWLGKSLDWIRAHPGGFLHGLRVKAVALWSWNLNPVTGGDSRWKRLAYTLSYAPLLFVAAAGLVLGLAGSFRRPGLFLVLVIGALTVVHVVIQSFTRMRLPTDPLLMLFAGLALVEAARALRARAARPD